MTHRSISEMTHEDLAAELRILRAALERLGETVTTTDILCAERYRDDTDPFPCGASDEPPPATLTHSGEEIADGDNFPAAFARARGRVGLDVPLDIATTVISPETSERDQLEGFLDDLGRLSARHGMWIESTPRGTLLYVRANHAAGYRIWPLSDRGNAFEFDCYTRDAEHEDNNVIVGNDHSSAGKEERMRCWREENPDALAEQNKLHQQGQLPFSQSFLQSRRARDED